jgi:hypothetical protein
VTDPVASGFVTSLTRPGGNVTGFIAINFDATLEAARSVAEHFPAAAADASRRANSETMRFNSFHC